MRQITLFAVLGLSASLAVAQATWSPVSSGTLKSLRAVASSGSLLVVVGDSGTVLTSPNGTSWTSRSSGVTTDLSLIIWGGGRFVAAGSGAILTSPDGLTWTTATNISVGSLAWTGTEYVAASNGISVITSSNGALWTSRPFPAELMEEWESSQVWLAGSGSTHVIAVRTGLHKQLTGPFRQWRTTESATREWQWSQTERTYGSAGDSEALFSLGDRVIGVGQSAGSVWWSSGAEPFSKAWIPEATAMFRSAARMDSTLVVVGTSGAIYSATGILPATGLYNTTLPNLRQHASGTMGSLNGVASFGNQFVAVGDSGRVFLSMPIANWPASVFPSLFAQQRVFARVNGTQLKISLPSGLQNQNLRIRVHGVSGEKVLETQARGEGEISMNVEALARGNYWVRVLGAAESLSASFTKL